MADKWTKADEAELLNAERMEKDGLHGAKRLADHLRERKHAIWLHRLNPLITFGAKNLNLARLENPYADGVANVLAKNAKYLRELLAPFDQ